MSRNSTDIIVISFHEAQERWSGCHCHPEFKGLIEAECIRERFPDLDSVAQHIAKLDMKLDEKAHNLQWEHTLIWSEMFDEKALEADWSARFEDWLPETGSYPDQTLRDLVSNHRKARQDAIDKINTDRMRAELEAERVLAEKQRLVDQAALEQREREEYDRLQKKFEPK